MQTKLTVSIAAALLAAGVAAVHAAHSKVQPTELLRAPMSGSCFVTCIACTPNKHMAQATAFGPDDGGEHPECIGGTCMDTHGECPGLFSLDPREKEDVWRSLTHGTEDQIKAVLAKHGAFIEVNGPRQMLQILDCNADHVIANIRISQRLSERLTTAIASGL